MTGCFLICQHTRTTVSRPSPGRRVYDAEGLSLLVNMTTSVHKMRIMRSPPFGALRASEEPRVPVLLGCRMNRFTSQQTHHLVLLCEVQMFINGVIGIVNTL